MRVSKVQIVRGLTDYIQSEILPKMGDDRAIQIIASIAVNAALSNNKLIDAILSNDIVRAMLQDDGSGTYEVGGVVDSMREAVEQYGSFPLRVPAIPLISPHEITLMLSAGDVEEIRKRIERSV